MKQFQKVVPITLASLHNSRLSTHSFERQPSHIINKLQTNTLAIYNFCYNCYFYPGRNLKMERALIKMMSIGCTSVGLLMSRSVKESATLLLLCLTLSVGLGCFIPHKSEVVWLVFAQQQDSSTLCTFITIGRNWLCGICCHCFLTQYDQLRKHKCTHDVWQSEAFGLKKKLVPYCLLLHGFISKPNELVIYSHPMTATFWDSIATNYFSLSRRQV